MRQLVFPIFILILSACTQVPIIDNSARAEAAVRVEQVNMAGGKGYFAYAGKQTTWTRGKQQRIQQKIDFTESTLGALKAHAERAYLFDALEPSLKLIDYDTEQYRECELWGCSEFSETARSVQPQLAEFDGNTCEITVEESRLVISRDTGTPARNGADAYQLDWRVQIRDKQERTGSSLLHGVLWLGEPQAKAAADIETSFCQQYAAVTGQTIPELQRFVPWIPMAIMEKYFLSTLNTDARTKVAQITIAPNLPQAALAGELTWTTDGSACGADKPEWRRRKQEASQPETAQTASAGDGVETFSDFMAAISQELSGKEPTAAPALDQDPVAQASGRVVFVYRWQLETQVLGEVSQDQLAIPEHFEKGSRF